jgi:hypothetical protein
VKRFSSLRRLVIALLLLGLAAGTAFGGQSSARAAGMPAATATAAYGINGEIAAIAAISPTNIWAVGTTAYDHVLIAHWNGKNWSQDKSVTNRGFMSAISMDSPTDGWAIGAIGTTAVTSLVLHWNGKTWSRDTSAPVAGIYGPSLVTVDGDVWVGGYIGAKESPVMLHRTGGRWYVVPVAGTHAVTSLAATSPKSIWGAGDIVTSGTDFSRTLLHWNGTTWNTVALPPWASHLQLEVQAMAPGPGGTVWAVGDSATATTESPVTMHWNGKAWLRGAVDVPGISGTIGSVASIPGGTAWALGELSNGEAVIMHWNGKAWTAVKSLAIKNGGVLDAIAATSPDNAWVAGYECEKVGIACFRGATLGLVLHWNGKTWS